MSADFSKANEFLKGIYVPKIAEQMARESAMIDRLFGPRRKGHYERVPFTDAMREEWSAKIAEWEALTKIGTDEGWLEEYSGEGPYPVDLPNLVSIQGEWVYDESEEDFEARKSALS